MNIDEAILLRRHVREIHPNLLGQGPETIIGFSPLPKEGLDRVPDMWLHAVHEASHAGLWADHQADDWLRAEG